MRGKIVSPKCILPPLGMQCLKHIVSYCEQIDLAVEQFGASYSIFAVDSVYRNTVALWPTVMVQ